MPRGEWDLNETGKTLSNVRGAVLAAALLGLCTGEASAQQPDNQDLAVQLSNPVAALISVPAQFNFDRGIGSLDDGERLTVNVQPVVPFALSSDWNLIT